uniref:metal ABC transporter permease n=1 Tax=Klebsiella pneumoniae TaxID=573 RepID=UPI001F02E772
SSQLQGRSHEILFIQQSPLLSVGVMVLPAVTARFWTRRVATMCIASVLIGMLACISGLLFSFHFSLPSGPSIILSVGIMYLVSAAAMMVKNIHLKKLR